LGAATWNEWRGSTLSDDVEIDLPDNIIGTVTARTFHNPL
jgi:hypothetical protein